MILVKVHLYPVHRQTFPPKIDSEFIFPTFFEHIVVAIPAVQNPHWDAKLCWKLAASLRAESSDSSVLPVTTSALWRDESSKQHDGTELNLPSCLIKTLQTPQAPSSQDRLVSKCAFSRSQSRRVVFAFKGRASTRFVFR